MDPDLSPWLAAWPYDPHEDLMVRRIIGPQGQARLQIRLELGLLELHLEGRPDGQRPHGRDSLLDYHLERVAQEHSDSADEPFTLDHDECVALQRESLQYYHRRLALLKIGDYAGAAADAERNLAIMDLLRERAANREDWRVSEQYRSFVLSHLARARMLDRLAAHDVEGAVGAVNEGIQTLEHLFREDYGQPELLDHSEDLRALREIRYGLLHSDEVWHAPPESQVIRLERELAEAVEAEDFERAALLRDRLTDLRRGHA